MSFSKLPAVKNDTIFGAARKIFGPSYFKTALSKKKGSKKLTFKMHSHFASVFTDYGIPPNPNMY